MYAVYNAPYQHFYNVDSLLIADLSLTVNFSVLSILWWLVSDGWHLVSVSLARVIAAKPHSCDVEHLMSTYNLIQACDWCSLTTETIDAHLHMKLTMPVMSEFDVRPALWAWLQQWLQQDWRFKFCPKAMSQAWFKGVFHSWTWTLTVFEPIMDDRFVGSK